MENILHFNIPIVQNKNFVVAITNVTSIAHISRPWIEISVNTDISVLGFYRYIGEISVDNFTQISVIQKLSKIDRNAYKNPKNDKINNNIHVKEKNIGKKFMILGF